DHLKLYIYSDHPHLRRSDFLSRFGRYPEGVKPDKTEYTMAVNFIQAGGKGLLYEDFTQLFYQKNDSEESSTIARSEWKQRKYPLTRLLRRIYLIFRWMKTTWDIAFKYRSK